MKQNIGKIYFFFNHSSCTIFNYSIALLWTAYSRSFKRSKYDAFQSVRWTAFIKWIQNIIYASHNQLVSKNKYGQIKQRSWNTKNWMQSIIIRKDKPCVYVHSFARASPPINNRPNGVSCIQYIVQTMRLLSFGKHSLWM